MEFAPPSARLLLGALLIVPAQDAQVSAAPPDLDRTIEVPLDHAAPDEGHAPIHFELGAPWDEKKPVVLVVADGQQFYVRKGAVAGLQEELFGPGFNVVGVVGRGSAHEFLAVTLDARGEPDWVRAWRTFRAEQWLDDLDAVRRSLVGNEGKVLLYGASGGALLVHQYLARHGAHVARAFTASPVNPFLVGDLGLNSDRFSEEVGAHDPSMIATLGEALAKHAADRPRMIMTLQRQNFFVQPAELQEARAALIRALAAGDEEFYRRAREEYQVDAVHAFFDSTAGIPIRVREFELFQPAGARRRLGGSTLFPDLENQSNFAAPLLALCDAGRIPAPAFDFAALHRLDAEVFVLAGTRDHTVDYRSAIALAASYPRHELFLADEDHLFSRMKDKKSYAGLLRAFLGLGLGSPELRRALEIAEPHRWRER